MDVEALLRKFQVASEYLDSNIDKLYELSAQAAEKDDRTSFDVHMDILCRAVERRANITKCMIMLQPFRTKEN